jgi:hypothetical protein
MIPVKTEPKTSPEYDAFKSLLNRLMAVPHTEIVKREAEYKRQSLLNPNRPGPRPKRKRASRVRPA